MPFQKVLFVCLLVLKGIDSFQIDNTELSSYQFCTYNYDKRSDLKIFSSNVIDSLAQKSFVNKNQSLVQYYPPYENDRTYTYEGTYRDPRCFLCRYHLHTFVSDACDLASVRACYKPMYAYCLDGEMSFQASCVQNTFIYPIQFFGEFWFPKQKPNPPSWESSGQYPMHKLLEDAMIGSVPSIGNTVLKYALSRANVISSLNGIFSDGGNVEAKAFVDAFKSAYNESHTFGLWGQMLCFPFCHRNNRYIYKNYVVLSDFQNISENFIVQLMYNVPRNDFPPQIICRPCQNSTYAVYYDGSLTPDTSTKHQYFASSCIPWFGSVPLIDTVTGSFSRKITSKVYLGSQSETYEFGDVWGNIEPNSGINEIVGVLCPVDTYNRICAYTHLKRAQDTTSGNRYFAKQVQCEACPVGWSTRGKVGMWFCIPPDGQIFTNRNFLNLFKDPTTNISTAWARRDFIKYEFECETQYTENKCLQCQGSEFSSTERNYTKEEFNERIIFDKLLALELCPANYYCPDPLLDKIACPPGQCSKSNSTSINDCSCCAGKYMDNATQTCLDCKLSNTCPGGQYLLGYIQCMTTIGPKLQYGGGICTPCSNATKPVNSQFSSNFSGIEISSTHICPFQCDLGYKLTWPPNQENFPACQRYYSCSAATPFLGPYVDSGQQFTNSYLRTFRDAVQIQGIACDVSRVFTANFQSWTNNLNGFSVYSSCSAANQSACSGELSLCEVVREATLFDNYACAACPLSKIQVPSNASILPEAYLGLTDISQRGKMCSWSCDEGYFKNDTTNKCVSCKDFSQQNCPVDWIIQGRGCGGISTDFKTPLSSNCVNCTQNLKDVPSGKYLDLDNCIMRSCPPINIPVGFYAKEVCGGSISKYTYTQCQVCLSANQYMNKECTNVTNTDCRNCTLVKPGFFKTSSCSFSQDAQWEKCPPNYYCDGLGDKPVKCPVDRNSFSGSSSVSDCFCRVGLVMDTSTQQCIPLQCGDETDTFDAPSPINNKISRYFYASKKESPSTTECVPCNSQSLISSFAAGNRVNQNSCRCNLNAFSNYIPGNSQLQNISCSLCSLRTFEACTPSSFYSLQGNEMCFLGSEYGNRKCGCFMPPFSNKGLTSCTFASCVNGFSLNNQDSLPLSINGPVQGSNMYIDSGSTAKPWTKLMNKPYYDIKKVKVTSDFKISDYRFNNLQVVLWSIRQLDLRVNSVFMRIYQDSDVFCLNDECDVYVNGNKWNPICPTENGNSLIDFTAFKWSDAAKKEYYGIVDREFMIWTWLGALVYDSNTQTYSLRTGTVYVQQDESVNIIYENALSYCGSVDSETTYILDPSKFNKNTSNIVSFLSLYSYPGIPSYVSPGPENTSWSKASPRYGAYYVAYNIPSGCGIEARFITHNKQLYPSVASASHLNMSLGNRQILAVAMTENTEGAGVLVYVIFSDIWTVNNGGGVCFFKWETAGNAVYQRVCNDNEMYLYFPSSILQMSSPLTFLNFEVLWPKDTTMKASFLLNVDYNTIPWDANWNSSLFTADSVQKTFTPIQGMILNSNPTSLSISETSSSTLKMFGSGKSSLYILNSSKCMSSINERMKYWDGSQCRNHHCIRKLNCDLANNQIFNTDSNRCECKDGYYLFNDNCIQCPSQFYCRNDAKTQCPSTMFSEIGSAYSNQCKCLRGYFYDTSLAQPRCSPCPLGFYCPNGWNKIQFPGNYKLPTESLQVFPTLCSCATGTEGVDCRPCPSGQICIPPVGSSYFVRNYAASIFVRVKQIDPFFELVVCGVLKGAVKQFFTFVGGFSYFTEDNLLDRRFYCQFLDSGVVERTHPMFITMLQADDNDVINNNAVNILFQTYKQLSQLTADIRTNPAQVYVDILDVFPADPAHATVPANEAKSCTTGFVPNQQKTMCECRAGYRYGIGGSCIPCAVGSYKPLSGNDQQCTACPSGQDTVSTGSTSCIRIQVGNETSSAGGTDSMPIIIGGVVGGVVVVVLLISVICFLNARPSQ